MTHFNPQGPHGPRRTVPYRLSGAETFQSTRPSRASTQELHQQGTVQHISIHKALTGLDWDMPGVREDPGHFNPQGPHGPRLPR